MVYLHIAHKSLFNALHFINKNRTNNEPYFKQYFLNYEK